PAWKTVLGRGLSRLVPALALPTDIDPAIVSHDPAVVEAYGTDPLVGHVASARWLTETTRAQADVKAAAARIKLPVLLQQAGDDRLASPEAAKAVFDTLGSADKTFTPYPGLFHEIWFEQDRGPVLDALGAWLDAHLP
ncbi:MAG: alpha/beta hydrolase, partial [Myxococcales bacterium]|nr:alpha/beta hydrolase [Myxococcales bacterium]